ncbi:MAG: 6-phosphofructokinase [Verrucomicrobia bacterium GWC2_42_7]|nr:MAG: 6-phosphofructokinase [Verrucomicrobia bacterium GWC2_42_7]
MKSKAKVKVIGVLTSGGDCPGLNAAIRGVAKAAFHYDLKVIGIMDGFRGLVENRTTPLDGRTVSGILTQGGTLLGTSREKPHKMFMGDKLMDMTEVAVSNLKKMQIDCLVCLGGNGTQKNALHLLEAGGVNIVSLPKTIDNDIVETDISFGFDTALSIATEAIDRLHTTATSHHRIIVCEIMGHSAGWLTLGSGIAGGADVILIPEIPYNLDVVAEHIEKRRSANKRFSIVAVAEGAVSQAEIKEAEKKKNKKKSSILENADGIHLIQEPMASRIARELQQRTGIDARVTSLGHVQRGGSPSATDRLLCTQLGTKAIQLIMEGVMNVMVAVKGNKCVPVSLKKVAGFTKRVPSNHEWVEYARLVDTCLGDRLPGV